MILLSVDTSSSSGNIALHRGDELMGERFWKKRITQATNSSHSELLTSSVVELLDESSLTVNDLTHLAVGVGPGSFTGIRVGINFVRALGYARALPVFSANSLALVAESVNPTDCDPKKNLLVIFSAFRNFVYYSEFHTNGHKWVLVEGPGVLTIEDLEKRNLNNSLVVGDGALALGLAKEPLYPLAKNLYGLAKDLDLSTVFGSWRDVKPLYLRRSEAEEKFGVVTD